MDGTHYDSNYERIKRGMRQTKKTVSVPVFDYDTDFVAIEPSKDWMVKANNLTTKDDAHQESVESTEIEAVQFEGDEEMAM